MRIINFLEFQIVSNGNSLEYPFVFLKKYSDFVNGTGSKFLLIANTRNVVVPIKQSRVGFLKTVQILFPPLFDNQRLSESEEKKYLNQLVFWLKNEKLADRIIQSPPFCIFKASPDGAKIAEFGTYFINLANISENDLFTKIHLNHKRRIKKGSIGIIKSGHDQLPVFYELYKNTMNRSGLYCEPFNYFKTYYEQISNNLLCNVIYFNEKPQGGLFIPYTNHGAYYLYGASADFIELNGAINYLHWETIKYFKKLGIKRYDFVGARLSDIKGTKLEGIQKFKSLFGSTLEKGFLWKKDIYIYKCKLFDFLILGYRFIKGVHSNGDIIDQENSKR